LKKREEGDRKKIHGNLRRQKAVSEKTPKPLVQKKKRKKRKRILEKGKAAGRLTRQGGKERIFGKKRPLLVRGGEGNVQLSPYKRKGD